MYNENHAHIILDGANYKSAVALHRNGVDIDDVKNKLKAYADGGITVIRDGGDNLGVSAYAKKVAGEFGIKYLTPVFALYKKGYYGSILGNAFCDMREFKNAVLKAKYDGADFIKLMASGILNFSEFGEVTAGALTLEELKEIIDIAHSEGFAVMVHVNNDENIRNALEAGADSIEHGFYIKEKTLDIMQETNVVWVPTLTACKNLLKNMAYEQSAVAEIARYHEKMIKYAFDIGVNVALGSDSGAYMVEHVNGIYDECAYIKEVVGNDVLFDKTIKKAQNIIAEKFGGCAV